MSRFKTPLPICACSRSYVFKNEKTCNLCQKEAEAERLGDEYRLYNLDACETLAEVKDWIKNYVIQKG